MNILPKVLFRNVFYHSLINTFTSVHQKICNIKEAITIYSDDNFLPIFLSYYDNIFVSKSKNIPENCTIAEPLLLNKSGTKIKEALNDLKDKIYKKHNIISEKKYILIIQREANRKIYNITKLVDEIKKYYSVKIVSFDNMALEDQVRNIAKASVVIASHGSALSHIALASVDTTFIELNPMFLKVMCFYDLANLFNIEFHATPSLHNPVKNNKRL